MIFAATNKGDYLLIDKDKVVGVMHRYYIDGGSIARGGFPSRFYYIEWTDKKRPPEEYATLPDVQDVHKFENYPGYGRVLERKLDTKPKTPRPASQWHVDLVKRYKSRGEKVTNSGDRYL